MSEVKFLFRKDFYEICQEIKEPELRLATYEAICEYGITGSSTIDNYPISERDRHILRDALKPVFRSIDGTKERYQRAVENGRKGGLKGGKLGGRGHKKKESTESTEEQR